MRSIQETETTGPTNAAGSGSIAGIGVEPNAEPGVYPKKKKLRQLFPMLKRNPLSSLKPKI